MNDNCCGGNPSFADEREMLLREIGELKAQRNELQTQLAQCRSANRALRAELGRDS